MALFVCRENGRKSTRPKRQTLVTRDQLMVRHSHTGSTIDAEHLSIDPLAILRGQEADNSGNVDGETDTGKRRPSCGILHRNCQPGLHYKSSSILSAYLVDLVIVQVGAVGNVFAADSVVHVSADSSWSNGVDGDLLVAEVDGHAPHKRLDGAL